MACALPSLFGVKLARLSTQQQRMKPHLGLLETLTEALAMEGQDLLLEA